MARLIFPPESNTVPGASEMGVQGTAADTSESRVPQMNQLGRRKEPLTSRPGVWWVHGNFGHGCARLSTRTLTQQVLSPGGRAPETRANVRFTRLRSYARQRRINSRGAGPFGHAYPRNCRLCRLTQAERMLPAATAAKLVTHATAEKALDRFLISVRRVNEDPQAQSLRRAWLGRRQKSERTRPSRLR
jgi:hypothetical protein